MITAGGRIPVKSTLVGSYLDSQLLLDIVKGNTHFMVPECSDRPDIHRRIGNKLFEFRELCGVVVTDELYATQEKKIVNT